MAEEKKDETAKAVDPKAEPKGDFIVNGAPGGPFELLANSGVKFGASGTVTVGGAGVPTTEWSATRIYGTTLADNKGGEVVVHVDDKTQFKGWMKK